MRKIIVVPTGKVGYIVKEYKRWWQRSWRYVVEDISGRTLGTYKKHQIEPFKPKTYAGCV
jgi:hypothetical protein